MSVRFRLLPLMVDRKYCGKCDRNLPLEGFSKNKCKKDGLQTCCKECKKTEDALFYKNNKELQRTRVRKFRAKIREQISNYKAGVGCKFCDETDPVALDFHHENGSDKEFTISKAQLGWNNLLKEIKKCEVVCACCHRKIHAGRILKARR